MTKYKLCPISLGLALGILWGLSVLITGLIAHYYHYGRAFVTSLGELYVGYTHTIAGSFIGAGIGFVDAFIFGALIALLYNLFSGCRCHKEE